MTIKYSTYNAVPQSSTGPPDWWQWVSIEVTLLGSSPLQCPVQSQGKETAGSNNRHWTSRHTQTQTRDSTHRYQTDREKWHMGRETLFSTKDTWYCFLLLIFCVVWMTSLKGYMAHWWTHMSDDTLLRKHKILFGTHDILLGTHGTLLGTHETLIGHVKHW